MTHPRSSRRSRTRRSSSRPTTAGSRWPGPAAAGRQARTITASAFGSPAAAGRTTTSPRSGATAAGPTSTSLAGFHARTAAPWPSCSTRRPASTIRAADSSPPSTTAAATRSREGLVHGYAKYRRRMGGGMIADMGFGTNLVDWSWSFSASGSLRGWNRHGGIVEISDEGKVTRSPYSFDLVASGPFALGRTQDGRYYQSTDHGGTWAEVAGPPSGAVRRRAPRVQHRRLRSRRLLSHRLGRASAARRGAARRPRSSRPRSGARVRPSCRVAPRALRSRRSSRAATARRRTSGSATAAFRSPAIAPISRSSATSSRAGS